MACVMSDVLSSCLVSSQPPGSIHHLAGPSQGPPPDEPGGPRQSCASTAAEHPESRQRWVHTTVQNTFCNMLSPVTGKGPFRDLNVNKCVAPK